MRQRVGVDAVIGDQMLVQFVGRQEPQLALRALAHARTIPPRAALLIALCLALCLALSLPAAAQQGDPLRGQQWHLDTVHAPDAWRVSRGDGVVVAVIDTGVDGSHPDLGGKVLRGVDLVDEGTPPDDPNGHGTLVAGILAAVEGNGQGIAGASPGVRILPVRVLDERGDGDSNLVARGVRWATDNGAHVINLSLAEVPGLLNGLGGLFGNELLEAIRYADERGVVVVAAAGNDGNSSTPYPSDLPLLVVGATDQRDQVWSDSNRDARTVFAPGVGIVSTWKDHGYGQANGTSFATPIVAAISAILRERGLNADEVRAKVESSVTGVGAGRGRIDFARAVGVQPAVTAGPSTGPGPGPDPTQEPSSGESVTAVPTGTASPDRGQPPPRPGVTVPAPGGTDAPSTVVPLPSGAGAPAPEAPADLEVQTGGEDPGSPGPARWIGLVAVLGVVGAFVRAARRP